MHLCICCHLNNKEFYPTKQIFLSNCYTEYKWLFRPHFYLFYFNSKSHFILLTLKTSYTTQTRILAMLEVQKLIEFHQKQIKSHSF